MHLTSTPPSRLRLAALESEKEGDSARVKMAVASMTTAVLGCVQASEIMILVVFGLTAWIWLQFSDRLPSRIV